MDKFILINDFIAAGYGVASLQENDYKILGDSTAKIRDEYPKLVIGPGTGLGESILFWDS